MFLGLLLSFFLSLYAEIATLALRAEVFLSWECDNTIELYTELLKLDGTTGEVIWSNLPARVGSS